MNCDCSDKPLAITWDMWESVSKLKPNQRTESSLPTLEEPPCTPEEWANRLTEKLHEMLKGLP